MWDRRAKIDIGERHLVAIALCCLLATFGSTVFTTVSIVGAMLFIGYSQAREGRRLRSAISRLEAFASTRTQGDIAERIENVAHVLEESALRDPERISQKHSTTGIPTREPLIAKMNADRHGVLGVLRFIDFDRLNAFDPTLGNKLLFEATVRLQAMLPPSRMLAHVDRAHMGIWFGPDTDEVSAQVEMDAIIYALSATLSINDFPVSPEVKIQLARLDHDDPNALLVRTLARLVVSESASTETQTAATSGGAAQERFALEQDLRLAISADELQLHFQPLIDAASNRVCGAEALIRWRHPQHGMIAPSRFIPLMESAGLAHDIGLWAINAACREARGWLAAGLHRLSIAVNISAHQLERDDLPTLVARTLNRHSLAPDSLEIELTESAALVDCERARTLFASLRNLGVRIAIDDFGTGYSSLSTLRTLSFDKIKIDREFVTHVEERKESQAICQSMIALARGLGISVIAEGAERAEEYAWLRRHGCNLFQGYYFSPPLEGPAFIAFAQDEKQIAAKLNVGPQSMHQYILERLSA